MAEFTARSTDLYRCRFDAPIAIPSVLTKFKLTKHMDLRLSYAYGFRSPTLQELYFSFHNDNHDIDGIRI